MKNFKKLSREDRKGIVAGINFPAYCFEGEGPGEGGCSPGEICSNGNVYLMVKAPEVEKILVAVVILILVSVRGELLHSLRRVRNFTV